MKAGMTKNIIAENVSYDNNKFYTAIPLENNNISIWSERLGYGKYAKNGDFY